MSQGRFYFKVGSAHRYVSSYPARRVIGGLAAALILFIITLLPSPLHAEVKQGDAAVISRETELRKDASPSSESLGTLPQGSLVTLKGEKSGRFINVHVELDKGSLDGWIESTAIRRTSYEGLSDKEIIPEPKANFKKTNSAKKTKTRAVPTDEVALLKREPSFSYGAQLGVHLTNIVPAALPAGNNFFGLGFSAGVNVAFYLDPSFRLRLEGAYTTHGGSRSLGDTAGFSFMDLAVVGEIILSPSFFIFGGAQYSYGLGITSLPASIPLGGASDLSGIWLQGGGGYRFPLNQISFLSFRARYMGALSTSIMSFQSFGFLAVIEIQG